ncbi:MAG TPA: polysaccharide biosynthesis/export family protein, partial [Planctomycetia bacterium]|nr:polysaccharide biosynthesis/export family protein [Planctomycetia bacterium]
LRKPPKVTVSIAQSAGQQQIRGSHLVRQDGTIGLGTYGSVHVVGLTLNEAKATIENHLSQRLLKPVVSVDVAGYNSKVVYVVTDGGGSGETVVRLPVTGNETVLDAVSQIGGLSGVSSKQRIWVARPSPAGACQEQVLPVDWCGIVRGGRTDTNYQLMSGDRVYIMAEPLVTTDTWLARIIAPMERILGFTLLGNSTVRAVQGGQNGNNFGGF